MKRLIVTLFLGLSLTSCNSQEKGAQTGENEKHVIVHRDAFQAIMDSSSNYQLIDVRTPDEFNSGNIEGSINIDYFSTDFDQQIAKLDRNKTTLIYCRSGGRSGKAAKKMEDLGFTVVYDLSGGFSNWK